MRILHTHTSTLARAGLQAVLSEHKKVAHIYGAEDSHEVESLIEKRGVNLLIAGHDRAEDLSLEDLGKVRKHFPELKILVISGEVNYRFVLKVLETGVEGYLTSECDEGEIIQAISAIARGEKFYCNKVVNIILEKKLTPDEDDDCDPTSLTQRETEITGLIAKGLTNRKIADHLFLSQHTVNTHRKNIMKKLGVNSTSGLVLYAVNAGLVKPEEIVS